ncbi:MAG: acyl carrier protein [Cyanobacteria bacterium]|jgi:acyl carrier protein|nr:acyl carrier protein [Cyanobacteria bacterium GSL.Bin1]
MQEKMIEFSTLDAEEIQDWLASQIAQQLGIDPDEIDIRLPFESYGLDSVQTMSIANLGKQHFGLELSPLVIWNYPNIESLSQYLADALQTSDREILEL